MKFIELNELCVDIIDCPHSTPEWLDEGVPVIRNYNLSGGRFDFTKQSFVDEETYNSRIKRGKPETDDIIISREAPIGEVAIVPEGFKCCLGQRLVLLKVDRNKCNPRYLLYALMSHYVQTQIKRVDQTGSIVSNFNIPDLKKLIIPVIDEQNRIAELLDTIDEKIQKNKKTMIAMDNALQLLYDQWFLDFEFPNSEGKPYKSSGGKLEYDKKLKIKVPKNWEVRTLENCIEFTTGISYTSSDISSGKGIPMINLASVDIYRNYKPEGIKHYDGRYSEEKSCKYGDLLIACTDLTRNADIIGCPIIVPDTDDLFLYSMDLSKMTVTTDKLHPLYLYMTLRTRFYHKYIKGFATGTNVIHLDTYGIKWYRTFFPDINLQKEFAKYVWDNHEKKCQIIKENTKLEELKDFVLTMVMNGQVRYRQEG